MEIGRRCAVARRRCPSSRCRPCASPRLGASRRSVSSPFRPRARRLGAGVGAAAVARRRSPSRARCASRRGSAFSSALVLSVIWNCEERLILRDLDGALAVVDAGDVDEDAVVARLLDDGLGDAHALDARAHDLERAIDRLALVGHDALGLVHVEGEVHPAGEVQALPQRHAVRGRCRRRCRRRGAGAPSRRAGRAPRRRASTSPTMSARRYFRLDMRLRGGGRYVRGTIKVTRPGEVPSTRAARRARRGELCDERLRIRGTARCRAGVRRTPTSHDVTVEIAGRIEQVRLDACAARRRTSDVRRDSSYRRIGRAVASTSHGIDAVGRKQLPRRVGLDVERREAEQASARVAGHDRAAHRVGAAQQRARRGRARPSAIARRMRDAAHRLRRRRSGRAARHRRGSRATRRGRGAVSTSPSRPRPKPWSWPMSSSAIRKRAAQDDVHELARRTTAQAARVNGTMAT